MEKKKLHNVRIEGYEFVIALDEFTSVGGGIGSLRFDDEACGMLGHHVLQAIHSDECNHSSEPVTSRYELPSSWDDDDVPLGCTGEGTTIGEILDATSSCERIAELEAEIARLKGELVRARSVTKKKQKRARKVPTKR